MQKKAIVYSQPNCSGCVSAKALLVNAGYEVEERVVDGVHWTKADFWIQVPDARSVPQIVIDDKVVGGLVQLYKFLLKE